MIQNFLLIAIRNFLRHRLYSMINVVGLSAGLVCVLIIYLWVKDEVRKDTFHADSEKIFHIVSNLDLGTGEIMTWNITPGPLGDDIRENSAGVEFVSRTADSYNQLFAAGEESFTESGLYADPDFFNIFSFKIIKGDKHPIGLEKNTIAISSTMATKFFGDKDPIGKVLKLGTSRDVEVKAVFEDPGTESSLQFDFILPFEIYRERRGDGFVWGNYDHPLYVKLTDASQAQKVIDDINARRAKLTEAGMSDDVDFYIQPFTDRYLYSQFENGVPVGGRIKYVQIFSVIAIFILIIACINFMNMATARATGRAKEVGIRKVVGAQRKSLILQFILESIAISLLSMIIASVIVYLILPIFNTLVGKGIVIDFTEPGLIIAALIIVLITGLLSGSYPAFVLSSYRPATVLKGGASSILGGSLLRRGLVTFQFALTIVLGISALVIYNQVQYINNKDIGYNRESVLTFSLQGELWKNYEAFRNEVLQVPGVQSIARADNSLVQVNNQNGSVDWEGRPEDAAIFFRTVCVDEDFIETMGLKVIEGRAFSREYNDSTSFVLNKRAIEVMGLKNPIGQRISQWGNEGLIVGIVEDFHGRSMHEAIDPMVLMLNTNWAWRIFLRFDGANINQVTEQLTALHQKFNPAYPLQYRFLDDDFERLYNNEKVTSSLAVSFTVMTIIISALGLLGLAAYTTERRQKEISIRKTLGASVAELITMICKEFVLLTIIAAIIGSPIAWFLMDKFLNEYAYHTEIGITVFAMTIAGVVVIAIATVIYQVTKAAIVNPATILRSE